MFRIAYASLFAALIALPVPPAVAAGYPEKPIRLLIPFPPGGGTDILARALQDQLEKALGAAVIIDNRGGAGGPGRLHVAVYVRELQLRPEPLQGSAL